LHAILIFKVTISLQIYNISLKPTYSKINKGRETPYDIANSMKFIAKNIVEHLYLGETVLKY